MNLSLRFIPVWRRNLRVWLKLIGPAILGNFGEPLLYLVAFGYGFGRLVGELDGMPYMVFLASGLVCSSAMFTASFETLYSAYTRMAEQKTWIGLLSAPLDIEDIVLGEAMWAATKGLLSGIAIMIVAALLGLVGDWRALLALPVLFLTALTFAGCGLIVTAFARNYDFFLYYFTLGLTPLLLLSGVFFPLDQMPAAVGLAAHALPLAHAVAIVRPLMTGGLPGDVLLHLAVIAAWGIAAVTLAVRLLRRRMLD